MLGASPFQDCTSEEGHEASLSGMKFEVVKQPGDGSCLFHCLNYGLSGNSSSEDAMTLRARLAKHIRDNASTYYGVAPLCQWVAMERGMGCKEYADEIEKSGWGGAIELAVFAKAWHARIQTYTAATSSGGGTVFRPMAAFGEVGCSPRIRLLFGGGNHYDVIVPRPRRHVEWQRRGHGRWTKRS